MFTGIVTDLGRIGAVQSGAATRLAVQTAYDTAAIAPGASIACSGICLSVVDTGPGWFAVELSAETLARTTAGDWRAGDAINLERSLKVGDELGGHLVFGHVDGVATLVERVTDGDCLRLTFAAPATLMPFLAVKGSVAVDGVSLTVNGVRDGGGNGTFEVTVIPHTVRATTLGMCRAGSRANLEIDMLARYVQRLLAKD